MQAAKPYSLETYAERHRADFDPHEPRPELWAALEKQLAGPNPVLTPAPPALRIVPAAGGLAAARPLPPPPAGPAPGWPRWQRVGLAAALALLLLAAGLGEAWKSDREVAVASAISPAAAAYAAPDVAPAAAPTADAAGAVVAAGAGGPAVDARLDTAVHGMERYYMAQLAERKEQLRQLAPSAAGEWTRELTGLDSSYQQLKRELPRHPQPEVVLTAMNRNLQIRLNILDQQLQAHATDPEAVAAVGGAGGEYVLADSRSTPGHLEK